MIKLRRFLKPFLPGLLIAIILLFVQAICELNLPNYMSNIVNVGIQQGGVEDSTPEALSQGGYSFITTFMDDDERAIMEQSYVLASGADKDAKGKPVSDTYPKAADEQIYVLRSDLPTDQHEKLGAVFGSATWTMVNVLKTVQAAQSDGTLAAQLGLGDVGLGDIDANELNAATGGDTASTDLQSLDFSKMYQLQPLFDMLPQQWFDDARSQALSMDESLQQQSGTMLVSGFYRELGADMGAIVVGYILRIGLIMLLITALSGVATVLVGYI